MSMVLNGFIDMSVTAIDRAGIIRNIFDASQGPLSIWPFWTVGLA
jgi:hypothetical protein